jgi:transaldolase
MTVLHDLYQLGQSIWLDYIRRSFIKDGNLKKLIKIGVVGMTSNPSIFEQAIARSEDYDTDIYQLVSRGMDVSQIYTQLSFEDIRSAADHFSPVYQESDHKDGYVSLEVNPLLANDTETTLTEAKLIWESVNRPNLMVKIPATKQGLPAITGAIKAGINVNVTLIFSIERYKQVLIAYQSGLENRLLEGNPINNIHSVASFFVSRIDSKVDNILVRMIQNDDPKSNLAAQVMGKTAISSAKLAYQEFLYASLDKRFESLKKHGANMQRPLWASTSTKNPDYSDILYIQELIGDSTVNTVPQQTLDAFLDHGEARITINDNLDEANSVFKSLDDLGISIQAITDELEEEGVASFAKSFNSLMESLGKKRAEIIQKSTI